MFDLTISVNSRGRPKLLLDVLTENRRNITGPNTCMLVNLDDDDEETLRHVKQIHSLADIVSIQPREDTNGAKYNRALVAAPARWYLPSGDHTSHSTLGFDSKFVNAGDVFPDGYGVVANGWAAPGQWYRCHQCISAKLADRMGFIYPPYFPFWFVDPFIDDVAYSIGRYAYSGTGVHEFPKPATHNLLDVHFWCDLMDHCAVLTRRIILGVLSDLDFQEPPWRRLMQAETIPIWQERRRQQTDFIRKNVANRPSYPQGEPATWHAEYEKLGLVPRSPEYQRAFLNAAAMMKEE